MSALYGTYNAAMVVYLTELIPAEVRATGFSLAYSVAAIIFRRLHACHLHLSDPFDRQFCGSGNLHVLHGFGGHHRDFRRRANGRHSSNARPANSRNVNN
jgi:hypothetical protein